MSRLVSNSSRWRSFIMWTANWAIASRVNAGTSRTVRRSPLIRKIGGNPALRCTSLAPSCRAAVRTRSRIWLMPVASYGTTGGLDRLSRRDEATPGQLRYACHADALPELRHRQRAEFPVLRRLWHAVRRLGPARRADPKDLRRRELSPAPALARRRICGPDHSAGSRRAACDPGHTVPAAGRSGAASARRWVGGSGAPPHRAAAPSGPAARWVRGGPTESAVVAPAPGRGGRRSGPVAAGRRAPAVGADHRRAG